MLCSRQCSQTSAGIWHGPRPQQRPEAHEGGALASETGDMWVTIVICPFTFTLEATCLGEESAPDGVQQATPPGLVHIDVAAAWRRGRTQGLLMQRHRFISLFLGHSSRNSIPLCKRSSRHALS